MSIRPWIQLVAIVGSIGFVAACSAGDNTRRDVAGEGGTHDGMNGESGDVVGLDAHDGSIDATHDSAHDGYVLPDGAVPLDDGTYLLPDGGHVLPDGAIVDASMTGSDGGDATNYHGDVMVPDGVTAGDGGWYYPDGAVWTPSCSSLANNGGCGANEVCGNGLDDNCNGLVDENCPCIPGTDHERCYDGCPTQAGVGVCNWGSMSCTGSGEFGMYDGHCLGAGHPEPVICGGQRDYLCDGIIDEGCSCSAGDTRACYGGPAATRNVGACQDGVQTCVAVDGGTQWGTCVGEVLPSAPQCDGIDHACDGMPFEGCLCMPGATRMCYDGPTGTEGVGLCQGGTQTCILSGTNANWGPCVGEVLPAPDQCDGIDRACNGSPDMGCGCTIGAMRSCYSGPTGTAGVGLCHAGTQTCASGPTGGTWGACTGQVLPSCDTCDGLDHLCNGMPNTGCACPPSATQSCYDGPAGTEGVGACQAGTQTCVSGAMGCGSSWSTCSGEVLPGPIVCNGIDHACDGNYAADCPCMAGATRSCYDGPAGTAGVGTCTPGTQSCMTLSTGATQWGSCVGEVLPAAPQCDGLDHACIGTLPNCAPMAMCPGAVTTGVNTTVTLSGSATAVSPATIASYSWTVIAQPAGSTYTFGSATSSTTTFEASNAGVYTVRLTVTDSMGRTASCSTLVTVTSRSYLGTEFWAVTTVNSELGAGTTFDFGVAIGNPNTSDVTVTISGGALTTPRSFTVTANSTHTEPLPWVTGLSQNSVVLNSSCPSILGCCDNSGTCGCPVTSFYPGTSSLVRNGAYHITTSAPVSAYQFNPLEFSSTAICASGTNSYTNDASLLLPTTALTGNYIVLAHQSFANTGSFVAIAGTSATATTVTVTLPTNTPITASAHLASGVTAAAGGSTLTYTLNQGDVVELVSTYQTGMHITTQYNSQDLTGATVTATNPVAVFAGEDCSFISSGGTCSACDHLEQQMFPQETWGRDVVVSQPQERPDPATGTGTWSNEAYFVRILSRENANTLTFVPSTAHASATLSRGQFLEFCATADFEVTGTQPFLVAQYEVGQNVSGCTTCLSSRAPGTVGDPSMVLEVPVQQYRHNYNFVVPGTYTANYLNVVGSPTANIQLDGAALSGSPTTIPGSSWAVWRLPINPGSHTMSTMDTTGFGIKVMGVAPYTSYMYPGGLDLQALP